MFRKILLLSLFLIIINNAFSQDYQIFKSGYEFYYKNPSGTLMPVKWNDVQITSDDTTFFSFISVRDTFAFGFPSCIDTAGGSILGKKAVKTINNKVSFINYQNDSIFFFPYSAINDSWVLFKYSDSSYIEAKMTDLITDSIFHILDTIKVFDLQAKDALGNNIANPFNNKQITLAKNNGFVQLFDFYLFPNDEQIYTLAGENWPVNGNYNIDLKLVYDFHPGDEYHEDFANVQYGQFGISTYKKTIKTCISRDDYCCVNNVNYVWLICKQTSVYSNVLGTLTSTFQTDTVPDTINFSKLNYLRFNHIPTEFFTDSSNINLIPNILSSTSTYNGRTVKSLMNFKYFYMNNCWSEPIADPGPYSYDYVQGCGGPYYSSPMEFLQDYTFNNLVYYKKGSEVWGTPIAADCNALSVEELIKNIEISVYPNPANNQVSFSIEDYFGNKELKIEIYDYTGKNIYTIPIIKSLTSINTESLNSGIYFYRVSEKGKTLKSNKFLLIK